MSPQSWSVVTVCRVGFAYGCCPRSSGVDAVGCALACHAARTRASVHGEQSRIQPLTLWPFSTCEMIH